MKTDTLTPNIKIQTRFKSSNVIEGGTVYFSTADARTLLNLSKDEVEGEEETNNILALKAIVRKIAEEILYTGGDTTDVGDLLKGLTSKSSKSLMEEDIRGNITQEQV
jgi:hypothetical protein